MSFFERCECGRRYIDKTGHVGPFYVHFWICPCDDEVPVSVYVMTDHVWKNGNVWCFYPFSFIKADDSKYDGKPMHWEIKLLEFMRLEPYEFDEESGHYISREEVKANQNEQYAKDYEKRTGKKI